MTAAIDTHAQSPARPSWRFLIGLLLVLTLLQLALYHEAFLVKPVNDDFGVPATEIHRGNADGPLAFFTTSVHPKDYRPLLAVIEWSICRWTMPEPWMAIHLMHFGSMLVYGLCLISWLRVVPLGRAGAIVAAGLTYLHPMVVAQVGGMDGFGGPLSMAAMWWGVLAVYVHRNHPWRAALLAGAWFLIAMLLKEYTLCMPLIAAAVSVAFPARRRVLLFVALVVVLTPITLGLMEVRKHIQLPGYVADTPVPNLSPAHVAKNTGLLAAMMLYFGHAAWVIIDRGAVNLALFAVSVAASSILLIVGLARMMLLARNDSAAMTHDEPSDVAPVTRRHWIIFLLLCLLPACFPSNVLPARVAEMYAIGLLMPVALLAGFAADGWRTLARPWPAVALTAFIGQLIFGAIAVTTKVSELRDLGDRADHMVKQLDAIVPADARDQTIAIVFLNSEMPIEGAYSIYRQHDDTLLLPGTGLPYDGAMEWRRPGKRLYLEPLIVESMDDVDLTPYRLAYRWHMPEHTFSDLKAGD